MKDIECVCETDGAGGNGAAAERGFQFEPTPGPAVEGNRVVAGRGVKLWIGKVALMVCPSGRKECKNLHCLLQPFCACARAGIEQTRKIESRVWAAFAICGTVAILVSLLWAILGRR